jgi:MFS family permease
MIAEYWQALRLFSRNVRLYLVFATFGGLCQGGIQGVLLSLFLLRLGYGLERIGLILAVAGMARLVCSVPAGVWGTRWGPRQALIAGGILYTLGLGACSLAMFVPLHLRTAWLLATLVLSSAGVALVYVNAAPFLTNSSGSRERSYVFSLLFTLMPLGGFAGSLLAGVLPGLWATALGVTLDEPPPYAYALLTGAALFLPSVVALLATSDSRTRVAREAKLAATSTAAPQPLSRRGTQAMPYSLIGAIMLVTLLQGAGMGATGAFFNVYLDAKLGAPTTLIGTLGAAGKLLAMVAPLVVPLLMTRWGSVRTTVRTSLGVALSLLPLALIPHWAGAGLGLAGVLMLGGMMTTAYHVYTQESVAPQWRPAMQAAITMAGGATSALVAFAGGHLIPAWGYPAFFSIAAGLTAASAALLGAYARVRQAQRVRVAA